MEHDERTWTTAEVARIAGVTSRTLRHYDAIGLLRPAAVEPGGLRRYGEAELVRLQQILVLRELGLGLDDAATALDGDGGDGEVTASMLRRHRDRLRAERAHLTALTRTVERTVERMEGGSPMDPAELFEGFDPARQAAWEEDLADRLGDEARDSIDESHRRVGAMSKDDAREVRAAYAANERALAVLLDQHAAPDDPRVQSLVDEHHAIVCRFWQPDASAYRGLGELYVEHPDFRARYDAVRPGLAELYRDAMAVYAQTRLS